MEINTLGLIAAITVFLSIWIGHIAVRKIESVSSTIWLPSLIFTVLGLLVEYRSLVTDNIALSTALGIAGIALLFDAFEFTRQQRRVREGHAPANPHNPRHARFLAEPNAHATTLDLLKREPRET